MAKTKISEWSATPASNTDIDGINIAEGCAPSGINDAIRELMAQVKDLYSGTTGDAIAIAGGGTGATTASAARTALGVAIGTDVLPVANPSYTGTMTGGTGVVNLGSGQFYKASNGNVGIGTSSPGASLHVAGTIAASVTGSGVLAGIESDYAVIQLNGASNAGGIIDFSVSGTDSKGRILYNNTDNYMWFGTNGTERARIDSSGNLLVGTTTASGKIAISVNSSQVGFYQNKPSGGNADHQQFYTDGSLFAKMTNRGSWYNFDNVYGSLSDETLKAEIVDATPKLAKLLRVQVRNFIFKADETKTKQIGVIAQELESVFPSMVDTNEDGIKSVKYSVFAPMLIKAIQEQQALITALTARVAALDAA